MDSKLTLFQLNEEMALIEDELIESGGELTPEIEERIAVTKEQLLSKVDGYNALLRKFAEVSAAVKDETDRLAKLKRTADNAQRSIREHLLFNMHAFGLTRLEGNLCKISVRSTTSLEVDEESMLEPYKAKIAALQSLLPPYITLEAKVSKTAIKTMYAGTGTLPCGCAEVSKDSLMIK